jgi:hypothetical protein
VVNSTGKTSDTLRARGKRETERAPRIKQTHRVYSASAASEGESLFPEKEKEDLDTPYCSHVATSLILRNFMQSQFVVADKTDFNGNIF